VAAGFYRKALILSYFTVFYNVGEGLVSIILGSASGSIALIGFGLDSFLESLSGSVMVWRFRNYSDYRGADEEKIERRASILVGVTFIALAVYVLYESIGKLYSGEVPDPSIWGIVIALVSLVVMPILFYEKYRTAMAIGSGSLVADSKETLACVFLSGSLLAGLGLNYMYGFWQADPVVGLIVVVFLIREGLRTFGDKS
jgi:divalent metal cation (Fe/Co/Zn/Cd) transporter